MNPSRKRFLKTLGPGGLAFGTRPFGPGCDIDAACPKKPKRVQGDPIPRPLIL
jgi:hypothetical protein